MMAFLASLSAWIMTAAGAAGVFLFKKPNRKFMDALLGGAAGVMIAMSFWSLLEPSIEMATLAGLPPWLPAVIGFPLGGIFIRIIDRFLPHLHPEFANKPDKAEGVKSKFQRSILLVLAVTLHNIPEGLAVGIAFGALAHSGTPASIGGAIALALGIGLHNLPEGFAVSGPLRAIGLSRKKSFFYGQLSGLVYPVAGVIGALAVAFIEPLMPYALAFAAGAMIFVVIEELVPESQSSGNTDIATMGALIGFTAMMFFDIIMG